MFSGIIAVSLQTLEKFNFCLWTHTLQSPAHQVLSIRKSCDWFLSLWFSHNEAGVRCSCSQCASASFGFSHSPLCPPPNCPARGLHTCLVLPGYLASSGFFLLFLPFAALSFLGVPEQKHPSPDPFCHCSLPFPPYTRAGFRTRKYARSPTGPTSLIYRWRLESQAGRDKVKVKCGSGDQGITETQNPPTRELPLDLVTHQVLKQQQ